MGDNEFKERAKNTLTRLGLGHWHVSWLPDSSYSIRGRVFPEKLLIEIYDLDEEGAWDTFIHEMVEIKLRSALRPYRLLVNSLIGVIQEIADSEKDRFIMSLNDVFEVARGSPPSA
jgi:hypothetical protein